MRAASPREELLRYVPEEVGFCLVVQNLRTHLVELSSSPFADQWRRSSLARRLFDSAEWQRLLDAERFLEKQLGVTATLLRDEVLGEAFAFAYQPGPIHQPDDEAGLFLLRARSEKTLATLLEKLNAVQKKNGELKALEERSYRGVKYLQRIEAKTTNYVLVRGPVLLFTGQESLLRQAIDRDRLTPAEAPSPLARRFEELKLDTAVAALAVNPRVWDAAIVGKGEEPAARMAGTAWKSLEAVGLGLHLEKEARLQLAVKMKLADLPGSLRRVLTVASKPSPLSSAFPDDALVSLNGRLDLSGLYAFLAECMPKQARETLENELSRSLGAMLGKDVIKDILPALGPEWAFCLTAPPASSKTWTPHALFALRIATGEGEDPVDQAVLSAIQSWAQLAVLAHNKQTPQHPLSLRTTLQNGVRVRALIGEGVFPPGVQPCFALKEGYLVLATSPGELTRVRAAKTEGTAPMLRMSLKRWRDYLQEKRDPLTTMLMTRENLTKEKALGKIEDLRSSLELFDRLELKVQTSPGLATFNLHLTPVASMRK